MRSPVLAALALLALANTARADDPSAPADERDCSLFSLEGLRIGMSLAEAKAALPDAETSKRDAGIPKEDKGKVFTFKRPPQKKLDRPRLMVIVTLDEAGQIASIVRDYVIVESPGLSVEHKYAVEPTALVGAFTERFGAPTADTSAAEKAEGAGLVAGQDSSEQKRMQKQTRTVTWDSAECDRVVTIDVGSRTYTPGGGMSLLAGPAPTTTPLLEASVVKRTWSKARTGAKVEGVVKF